MDNIKIILSFQKTDTGYKIKDITLENGEVFEKKEKPKSDNRYGSVSWLKDMLPSEVEEIAKTYGTTPDFIKAKADDLYNYCSYKGRKYKNYRLFLINAVKKDKPAPARHADL